MTTPTIPQVKVEPGSRLDDLLAMYDQLKAAAEEAEARFDTVKNAIKFELGALGGGAPQVDVAHSALTQPLRLSYVESWRLDAKRMKAEAPETYVRYAAKSGSWQLRGVKP